ncbi:hypothetical protein A2Y99_02020 [Candidatus Gottesmanbacteria bacterium RBG_13_37_7]|uniref:Type II secretion system protein GspF domain-containing protein n=1 Tax=Candidatus Gottesmanbacteria bacterium RBG_13_37_7 TaxID=1798369 RepID=A0A1F5YID9_9BACT|nr:MAG: hypothetical protein A2Y99_02020 [Candidatus Gottesmanbacteria bacterium RBG_13_37_7]
MNNPHLSLSDDEKLTFVSNFSTMLTAGISVLEISTSLLEDAKGNLKKVLETLKDNIIQGKRLYHTFAQFPSTFDKVTVNLIKAAEEAGTLEVSLKDLKQNLIKDIEFKDKIKAALIYPALIGVVFAGVLLMILIFIMPKISQIFSKLKVDLPLPTRIMIFVSNTILAYTIPIIVFLAIFFIFIIFFYKRQKRLLTNFIFSLPLLSLLAKEIDLTNFARSFSLLLRSGIPIISALELTEDIAMKKEVGKAIHHARNMVLSGKKLSEAFKDNKKVIPTIMIKITEAGEKSGALEKTMQEASEYLDYRVTKTLKTVTTMIEPIMLVLVGVAVGAMMLAIISPMYGMIGQMGR